MASNPMAGASSTTVPSTTLGNSVTSLPLSTNTVNTSSSTSEGVPMHEPIDEEVLADVASMLIIDSRGNQIPFGRIYEYQRTMCASYVSALARVPTDALDAAGTKIVLIGCGAWDMIPTYQDTTKFRGLVYSDPTCKLHDAFGLISDLVVPPKNERSIRSYVPRRYGKAVRKGIVEGLKQPINAMTGRYGPIPQLGGDFILGPGNVCTYAHRMKNTMDHLEVHDLMALAEVQLPIPQSLSSPPSRPKQKRSQHSISYSFARPLMGDVEEDYGVCTLPPAHNSKPSSSGIPVWSSSASTKSAGGGGGGASTPNRRRSPSHASTSNARPAGSSSTTTVTSTTTTPLEERWNARPVSMILRGTGSESDLMYRAHQGLGVNAAVSAGIGGPGVVSGGYGYFDVGDVEEALSQASAATTPAGGPGGTVWYSYAGADGKKEEKDSYWKAAGGGSGGKEPISASGTDSSGRGKKRPPNPYAAISVPVQTVPPSGLIPSPTTSGRPVTASGILGGEKVGIGKGEAGRPSTALGMRRPEIRSLSTASSSIPVLKKSSTPKKLKRSSTTTAVPTLITTTPASATSALTIPSGPPQFMSASPSSASTSPPFSPTTPTTSASSPSRSPPTSPLKSPPTKKRSLTSASATQPPATGPGTHPPLSPSHSFALSFSSQAPSSAHPPSPMTLPPSSAASSSPPTPSMSSSPPRGAVNAKIIDPVELLSVDMDSWSNARSASRPTTAGGSSSIRSVLISEDGSTAAAAPVVPAVPTPASIGRRMRQMSLSDGARDDRR
ncbi:hypothetical protein FRC04_003456 [Tulasnella sp. 424]|nr:hypothetical protein FRC04_003456 [Tulasnella sp. 424]